MAQIIEITDINDPRVRHYTSLTDSQLRACTLSASGIFIAESPKVIRIAIENGLIPLSFLCEKKHIIGDAKDLIERMGENIPVFTGERDILAQLTGYTLTRGVLCAMKRPADRPLQDVLFGATRIAVIDNVCDATNTGSIFRAAAALGIDGILLTSGSCDPLNRRAIRVSMGNVFKMKWTWLKDPISVLKDSGFRCLAMALRNDALPLDSEKLRKEPRLAIILGTEGDGLADSVIEDADYRVVIPMKNGVDSLNVASAAAVAFWELRDRNK